jgi:hypothetical protein
MTMTMTTTMMNDDAMRADESSLIGQGKKNDDDADKMERWRREGARRQPAIPHGGSDRCRPVQQPTTTIEEKLIGASRVGH